jgi:hypothetical protein
MTDKKIVIASLAIPVFIWGALLYFVFVLLTDPPIPDPPAAEVVRADFYSKVAPSFSDSLTVTDIDWIDSGRNIHAPARHYTHFYVSFVSSDSSVQRDADMSYVSTQFDAGWVLSYWTLSPTDSDTTVVDSLSHAWLFANYAN